MIKDTIESSHLAPSILCALRYGLAGGLLLPFLLKPGLKKVNWGLSFELGLTLFLAYQCQARELVTESASEGSIMLAVYLLLVPLVELGFGRPFTSKKVASLLVAIGGVALLAAGVHHESLTAYAIPASAALPICILVQLCNGSHVLLGRCQFVPAPRCSVRSSLMLQVPPGICHRQRTVMLQLQLQRDLCRRWF